MRILAILLAACSGPAVVAPPPLDPVDRAPRPALCCDLLFSDYDARFLDLAVRTPEHAEQERAIAELGLDLGDLREAFLARIRARIQFGADVDLSADGRTLRASSIDGASAQTACFFGREEADRTVREIAGRALPFMTNERDTVDAQAEERAAAQRAFEAEHGTADQRAAQMETLRHRIESLSGPRRERAERDLLDLDRLEIDGVRTAREAQLALELSVQVRIELISTGSVASRGLSEEAECTLPVPCE